MNKKITFLNIFIVIISIFFVSDVKAINVEHSASGTGFSVGSDCLGYGGCPTGNVGIRIKVVDQDGNTRGKSLSILNRSIETNKEIVYLLPVSDNNNSKTRYYYNIKNSIVDVKTNISVSDARYFADTWVYDSNNHETLKGYLAEMLGKTIDEITTEISNNLYIMVENITGISIGKRDDEKTSPTNQMILGTPAQLSNYFTKNVDSYRYYFNDIYYGNSKSYYGTNENGSLNNNWAYNVYMPKNMIGLNAVSINSWDFSNQLCKEDSLCFFQQLDYFYKTTNYGYGVGAIKLSEVFIPKETCNYDNPDHFKANREGWATINPDYGSGPNDENCCIDSDIIIQGGNTFWFDHPECANDELTEQIEETTHNAVCNENDRKSTYSVVEDHLLWQKIFAYVYADADITGSVNKYVRASNLDNEGYCQLLCYENLELNLPSPYKNSVFAGGYFVWPSLHKDYNVKLTSNVKCKVFLDKDTAEANGKTINGENGLAKKCSDKYIEYINNNYKLDVDIEINDRDDPEYSTAANIDLELYSKTNIKHENSDVETTYEGLRDNIYSFSQTAYYILPKNAHRYLDLDKNIYWWSKENLENYKDIKHGVLPVSNNVKDEQYSVNISYSNLGGFTSKWETSGKNYTCSYSTTKDIVIKKNWLCPSGTSNEGFDLSDIMKNCGITYPEAINKFCDQENPLVCASGTYYSGKVLGFVKEQTPNIDECALVETNYEIIKSECHNPDDLNSVCGDETDYPGKVISEDCLSDTTCYQKECYNSSTVCKSGTDYAGENKIGEITDYMNKHKVTYDVAEEVVCNEPDDGPPNGSTKNIIYRTISLDFPFPGKDGRYRTPGLNWNAESNFENGYITGKLYSRDFSVLGNELYTKKEPMYVIELNPTIIKKIRAYNDDHSYDDFNLNCLQNNNSACVSTFLHGANIGTEGAIEATVEVTGTCTTINTVENFKICDD